MSKTLNTIRKIERSIVRRPNLKKVKVWVVMSGEKPEHLAPWGCTCVDPNGLWRYPAFPSRTEARGFKRVEHHAGKIVPATFSYPVPKPTKKK